MERLINGIQQVGIGVADAQLAFAWYKKHLGFDTVVFEDIATASLMQRYTGGQIQQRYAVLAMNMQGGGGLEIWQYTNRKPSAPAQPLRLGDRGIYAIKIKCKNVKVLHAQWCKEGVIDIVSSIATDPSGKKHFFIRDPFDNLFQLIDDDYWFQNKKGLTGGVCGAVIGVSDLDKALLFYEQVPDYKTVHYLAQDVSGDLKDLPGGDRICNRAIIKHVPLFRGAFSTLLGPSTIELIEVAGTKNIFENRYWGDLGFIHVCYDICSMKTHEIICKTNNHPLTINSIGSFEMGEAGGQFSYNEDPDGTLIEYVETHKVPIIKSLGLYLNLGKRKNIKALPRWVVKCIGLSKKSLQLSPVNTKGLKLNPPV